MYNSILTVIGTIAVMVAIVTAIVTVVLGIIGLTNKDYINFKKSLWVLLATLGVVILTVILFAVGQMF